MQEWYGLRDLHTLARELSRRPQSVQRQAEIVCSAASRSGPWSADEIASLKRYVGSAGHDVIARVLGRPIAEVRRQIHELGRHQREGEWTRDEKNRLKRIFGSRRDEDLALIFGRPVESVRAIASELLLAKSKAFLKRSLPTERTPMPRWTDQALAQLRRDYPTEPNAAIAAALGRSVKSVVSKAHHLGLRKEVERLREMGRENVRLRYANS